MIWFGFGVGLCFGLSCGGRRRRTSIASVFGRRERQRGEERNTNAYTHRTRTARIHASCKHAHNLSLSLSLREHEYEHDGDCDGAAVLGACVCWRVGLPYIATCVVCLNTFCMNERNELIINTEMRMMCVFCIFIYFSNLERVVVVLLFCFWGLLVGHICWWYRMYPESYV